MNSYKVYYYPSKCAANFGKNLPSAEEGNSGHQNISLMRTRPHMPARISIARIVLGTLGMLLLACPRAPGLDLSDPSLDLTQYTHRAWTALDGLKGSTRSIVQTPDGYLWLGTEFGIVRFDGVHFVPWTPPLGESLPSTNINTLLAARDGTLWTGTLDGLASWNRNKLTQYPDFAGGSSHVLLEDHEGTVWVGASGKLCAIRAEKIECYGDSTSSVTGLHYLYTDQIPASSMYEDSEYRLWVGTGMGLWRWKPGTPKRYMPQPLIADQAVVAGDRAGELVFISGVKNDLWQLAGERITEYTVPGIRGAVNASSLLRDRNGALWIGTYDQGLLRVYQGKTSRFAMGEGLSGNLVTALFEDREGSVWVGTTSGVDRFSEPVISTLSAFQGLPSPAWSVFPARDGSVWIGSFDGLSRWWQGQLTTYRSTGTSGRQIGQSTTVDGSVREIIAPGLPGNNIGSLYEDKRGRIWITTSKGVTRFENGRFTRVNGLPDGSANAIIADQHDGVWISYPTRGLFHLVHGTVDQFKPWPWSSEGKEPRISAIVPDPLNSALWLGSINAGIARFNNGKVSKWLGSENGLGANLVWNLHVDHEGTLWAATEGGLSRIKDGTVSTLTTKNGLPCNAVHWVTEDDASSLWLSTVCGLLRVDRSDLQAWTSDAKHAIHATAFDGSDGFRSHAMLIGYSPVVKKSPDGKLWFAHNDGVSVVDPRNLRLNKVAPPVHIEQVRADGKAYDPTAGLRLPPRVRDLSIDFTALSLVAPEKVRFRFKLDGQDTDWREVVNQRRVEYSNLPPRHYRFRVMACNNSGVWNEEGAALDFAVDPAYWQTNWFRALCGLTFLAMLWGLYQLRVRQLAHQFDMTVEARVGERTRIARELHDTLLQSFHGLMLRFQTVDEMLPTRPMEAKDALEGALERADQAIIEGRDAISDIRASTVEGHDLAKSMTALMTDLSEERGAGDGGVVTFRVLVEGTPRSVSPIVQDDIYRIARESLRNAFRHADARSIETEITYGDSRLCLRFRDDGKGIDPRVLERGGRSRHWGLPGMRERAKQIGAELEVWSELGAGTEVELSIPGSIAYVAPGRRRTWLSAKT